jgi:hypothetical protein
VAKEVTANMIGMIVGNQRSSHRHAIGLSRSDYPGDVPRRVDNQTLPALVIPNQIDEVCHLSRENIVAAEIFRGQQLPQVQSHFLFSSTVGSET